jgi:hypothetical protein
MLPSCFAPAAGGPKRVQLLLLQQPKGDRVHGLPPLQAPELVLVHAPELVLVHAPELVRGRELGHDL